MLLPPPYLAIMIALEVLLLTGCGQETPKYHISYSGSDPGTSISSVKPEQIDAAAGAVAQLVGFSPEAFAERGLIVYLHRGPIQVWGEKLYGDAEETAIQSQLLPCLLQSDSALIHELLHEAFYLTNKSPAADAYDNKHTSPLWHEAESRRVALEISECYK